MSNLKGTVFLVGLALALSQGPEFASGQGKGQGKDKVQRAGPPQSKGAGKQKETGKEQKQDKAESRGRALGKADNEPGHSARAEGSRGKSKNAVRIYPASGKSVAKGNRHEFKRIASHASMPQSVRHYATSRRARDVIMAAAISHAFARGHGGDFRVRELGDEILITNLDGDRLVFLDDDDARDLGRWRVGVLDDDLREGSPAFCRSGAGHPVWGRDWCLDKGFGLGSYEDFRWGRTHEPGDIVFVGNDLGSGIIGNALASVLGTSAFNRLALHAVTLGLVEPLIGRWVSEPAGPQLLMVNSGTLPVAEFVDVNRDNRVDNMLVAVRPWY